MKVDFDSKARIGNLCHELYQSGVDIGPFVVVA